MAQRNRLLTQYGTNYETFNRTGRLTRGVVARYDANGRRIRARGSTTATEKT